MLLNRMILGMNDTLTVYTSSLRKYQKRNANDVIVNTTTWIRNIHNTSLVTNRMDISTSYFICVPRTMGLSNLINRLCIKYTGTYYCSPRILRDRN